PIAAHCSSAVTLSAPWRPPRSTPFPYTTLFRSSSGPGPAGAYSLPELSRVADADPPGWEQECRQIRRTLDDHGIALLDAQTLGLDRKSTRLNSSHVKISYAVFCLKKKKHPECMI